MDNIPNDIVHLTGKMKLQCGRDYYMKKATEKTPISFYFRVSVSIGYNSTVVFLCDDTGELLYSVDDGLIERLKEHYRNTYTMDDERVVLYSGDHTEEETAIWNMSDHLQVYQQCCRVNYDLPELLYKFWKGLESYKSLDDLKTKFTEQFQPGLGYYEEYYSNSTPPKDTTTEVQRLEDINYLARQLVTISKTLD